jgi:hypothetical protein
MLDNELPGGQDKDMDAPEGEESFADGSLSDDITALIDDGKTYVEAEIAFQKTRLAFVADRGKSGIIYAVIAFAVLHLAVIALVVGSIFALAPLITAWGATAVVVSLLLLSGIILGLKAKNRFKSLVQAFEETQE